MKAPELPVRTVRIGVTGLARAGKTAFLTSLAANLLAFKLRDGLPHGLIVTQSPLGAGDVPRFDVAAHLQALAEEPPRWPERTGAISLLALDVSRRRALRPRRRVRLELLDYPGEWLLDLPLLRLDYAAWSAGVWRRLERPELSGETAAFRAFALALPAGAPSDDSLARQGQQLFRAMLSRLREDRGLSLLQPGRFLMPGPGAEPPWTVFFPWRGRGPLAQMLEARYDAYVDAVRRELVSPLFGQVERVIVLADVLGALNAGQAAFDDASAALRAAAGALNSRRRWWRFATDLAFGRWSGRGITRVAYAATKADHVAQAQRGNLAALVGSFTVVEGDVPARAFAIAAIRCTVDATMALDGRAVSAVEGVKPRIGRVRSYPGEVPNGTPPEGFWSQPFFSLPQFSPPKFNPKLGGVPELGMGELVGWLLEDLV